MKLDLNKEMSSWLVVLNNNAKWSTALLIRGLTVFFLIVILLLLIKWTGIISEIKNVMLSQTAYSEQKEVVHESKPSTPTYTSDIQKTTNLQKLIMDKIKKKRSEDIV